MKRRKHTLAVEITFNRETTAKTAASTLQAFMERMREEDRHFVFERLTLQKFETKEFDRAVSKRMKENHTEATKKLAAIRRILAAV